MNIKEWIQLIGIIISTLGVIISTVGVVIVLPWWLRGKFSAQEKQIREGDHMINNRVDMIKNRLDIMTEVISTTSKVNETVITILSEAKLISSNQQTQLYRDQSEAYQNILETTLNWAGEKANPLTREEVAELRKYKDMMLAGERFSLKEAKDFHALVHKLEKEPGVPGDGLGVLIGLSTFILGTTRASQTEEEVKSDYTRNRNRSTIDVITK